MMHKEHRLYFVENLRILLVTLVILQHLTITFGGPGDWYVEGQTDDPAALFVFSLHNAVNQAFFMGFFFLIAGYFTPGSYDRKGTGRYLKDRLLRLGVPLLFYDLVINPLLLYAIAVNVHGFEGSLWDLLALGGLGLGSGPMWFVARLLIFTFLYVLWRLLARPAANAANGQSRLPGNLAVAAAALLLGVAIFVKRIWLPFPENFGFLTLDFPFFPPHYFALFVIGVIAYRRNWFLRIPDAMGRLWLGIVVGVTAVLFPILFVAGGALQGDFDVYMGGPHWQAFAYALWEQFICMGMIIGLLVLFRKRFDRQGKLASAMSASAYAVYVFHPVVLVSLGLALRDVHLHPLLMFASVAPVAVALCFSLGYCIRKLPLARRVL